MKLGKKIINLKLIFILLSFLLILPFTYADKINSEDFLNYARNTHPVGTWAILNGTISNFRRDSKSISDPIKIGLRFTSHNVIAKIFLNDKTSYSLTQQYGTGETSLILDDPHSGVSIGDYGLRPDDITLGFLFWTFVKELPETTTMTEDCRVFLLENQTNSEEAKVYISTSYYYPLKVEWFKLKENDSKKENIKDDADKSAAMEKTTANKEIQKKEKNNFETTPYRTMVVDSFEKVQMTNLKDPKAKTEDSWSVSSFKLYGPGWITKVNFDSIQIGKIENNVPADIFTKHTQN